MFVAPVEGGRLGEAKQSPAPSGGRPVGFAGAAVLMVREGPGAGTDGYDLWWPGRAYTAAWQSQVTGVYGLLPDGRTLVAQVSVPGGARPCLALLDSARALAVVKRTCAPGLSPGGRGAVSPDGRWLVANGVPEPGAGAAGPAELLIVDLGAAFGARPVVKAAEPRLTGDVVWIGGRAFVHAGEQGYLVRVTLDPVATGGEPGVEKITTVGESAGYRMVVVGGCVAELTPPASPVTSCR
jgi:hypothetical protein